MTGAIRGPLGGYTQLVTADGRVVRVHVSGDGLRISDGRNGEAVLPYPSAGYGGHELVLSPGERYLVMWLYSGQSEVGYELFEFNPLRHVRSFPYVYGLGTGPVFSPDERFLAMAWTTNSGLRVEEALGDQEMMGDTRIAWATVHVRDLNSDSVSTCNIDVLLLEGSPEESDESYYPTVLSVSARGVRLESEWASPIELSSPLPAAWMIDGPKS